MLYYSADLDLSWGLQGQGISKHVGFWLMRMKRDMVLKQFKMDILILILSQIFDTTEASAVLLTASKMLACIRKFLK